jgi:hypothetical protein
MSLPATEIIRNQRAPLAELVYLSLALDTVVSSDEILMLAVKCHHSADDGFLAVTASVCVLLL